MKNEQNIPDGCEPFNLERCIAGDEVVTRDGRPYEFGAYSEEAITSQSLLGWVDKTSRTHESNGDFVDREHPCDLFMKKKDVVTVEYRNVYFDGISGDHNTLDSAINTRPTAFSSKRISTAKITITNGFITEFKTVHMF